MTKKFFFIVLSVFILFLNKAFPAASGMTVFDFLKLPKNAIQASLASMSSFGKNASMPNPAVLGLVDKYNIQATHASHFQDVSYNSVYFAVPIKQAVLSIMYDGLDYGNMDRTIEASDGDYVKDGFFSADDSCAQINAGRQISKEVIAGAGMKYVKNNIDGGSLSGMAIDLAVLYLPSAYWSLSGGLENVGFKADKYNLPCNAYISYKNSLDESFDIGFELKTFFDGIIQLKGAFEINRDQVFFLRGGYSCPINNNNNSLGEWYKRNLSFGFGINIKKTISIDYAWLPYGELGNMSVFSLRVEFK
ncbi:MAG: hypothetical protein LBS61_04130 [Endomicrobium sp.]|nr:hypothetical protein [Endomicrobium sp.]